MIIIFHVACNNVLGKNISRKLQSCENRVFECSIIDFSAFLQTSSQILPQSASTRIIYVLCVLSFYLNRCNSVFQICIS